MACMIMLLGCMLTPARRLLKGPKMMTFFLFICPFSKLESSCWMRDWCQELAERRWIPSLVEDWSILRIPARCLWLEIIRSTIMWRNVLDIVLRLLGLSLWALGRVPN